MDDKSFLKYQYSLLSLALAKKNLELQNEF